MTVAYRKQPEWQPSFCFTWPADWWCRAVNEQQVAVALAAWYVQHIVNNSIILARSLLLLLSCPFESTGFSLHSLVITSWYSYLSPHLGVLLPGGGGRICLALMNPCGLPKNPTLNLLKCLWQALKRLLSLTKMGSIKMSDETKRLSTFALILVEHQHCVIAVTHSNIKEIISANYPFSYNTGFEDIWGSDRKCRNQGFCWKKEDKLYRTNTSFAFCACGCETQR